MGWPGFATVSALLAEIERLRLDRADIDHAYAFARNKAMLLERAAVVAWLREQANSTTADSLRARDLDAAEIIERGEHRREEDK